MKYFNRFVLFYALSDKRPQDVSDKRPQDVSDRRPQEVSDKRLQDVSDERLLHDAYIPYNLGFILFSYYYLTVV